MQVAESARPGPPRGCRQAPSTGGRIALTVRLPDPDHKALKRVARQHGVTQNRWVCEAIGLLLQWAEQPADAVSTDEAA